VTSQPLEDAKGAGLLPCHLAAARLDARLQQDLLCLRVERPEDVAKVERRPRFGSEGMRTEGDEVAHAVDIDGATLGLDLYARSTGAFEPEDVAAHPMPSVR
jgi:hypothetical protein